MLDSVQQQIYSFYDFCHKPGRTACTDSELAAAQLVNSEVTEVFPPFLKKGVTPGKSFLAAFNGIDKFLPKSFKSLELELKEKREASLNLTMAKEALFRSIWLKNTTYFEHMFAKKSQTGAEEDLKGLIR